MEKTKELLLALIVAALAIALFMSGCSQQAPAEGDEPSRFYVEEESVDVEARSYIVTDGETGVQYLYIEDNSGYAGGAAITPLYEPDGRLFVVNVQ